MSGEPRLPKWNDPKPERPEPGPAEPRAPGLRGATRVLFERELSLAWGGGGGPLLACAFFACLTAILPLAAGGELKTLAPVAAGVAWLALALSSLLSLERSSNAIWRTGRSIFWPPAICRWNPSSSSRP